MVTNICIRLFIFCSTIQIGIIMAKAKKDKILKILISVMFVMILSVFLQNYMAFALDMDVKCTVYEGSDEENGNNVDVRILVLGLNVNSTYTAEVLPDHNPATSVTTKADKEGMFWAVAKVPNGEKSLLFNVNVFEGKGTNGNLVVSGDDDAPCYNIAPAKYEDD